MLSTEDIKNSVETRSFIGANPLPFDSYILSLVSLVQKIPIVGLLFGDIVGSVTIFLIIGQLISKICLRNKKEKYGIFDIVVVAMFVISGKQEVRSTLTGLIIFMIVKKLVANNLIAATVFLSFLTVTDMSFIPIMLLICYSQIMEITSNLLRPNIKISKSILKFLKFIFLALIVPFAFAVSFISLDILVRNKHSAGSLTYSLEFQAGLQNFDIKKGLAKAHSPGPASETDLYVMDRSIISLVSYKYRTFFKLDKDIKGLLDSTPFCEIHKVHGQEFTDEEPRFIKNGDIVKFKDLKLDTFLGWDKKDSKNKFRNIYMGEFKDKEDFWIVECDGYLQARSTKVEFKSVKSNDYLCTRKMKNLGVLSVSYTAESKSKLFYVAENENHLHYKTNFEDKRAKMQAYEFLRLPFSKMLLEYIKSIDVAFPSSPSSFKDLGILEIFSIFMLIASFILFLIIYVIAARSNKKTRFSDETILSLLGVAVLVFFLPIIGLKFRAIEILSLMFTASLIKDLIQGVKTHLIIPQKTSWKKIQ